MSLLFTMATVVKSFASAFRAAFFLGLGLAIYCPTPGSCQGMKSVLEVLGGGAKPGTPELAPSEQVDWAKAQLESAKTEEKEEASLVPKLAAAGLPAGRLEDFRTANREIQRHYQAVLEILPAFLASDGDKPVPVSPPASEKEAADMRDELRRVSLAAESAAGEQESITRFISENQALQANAERESRQLQEELDGAKNPESRARAEVQVELSNARARAAASAVFLGKWRYAQQESLAQKASQREDALRTALRAGGFDRQIEPRRAASQLAAIESESAEAQKQLAVASKEQTRLASEAAALRGKADSAIEKIRADAAGTLADAAQRLVFAFQAVDYLLGVEKSHWNTVKTLSDHSSPGDLRAAMVRAGEIISKQNELRPGVDRRMIEAREALDAAQKQLRTGVPDPARKALLEQTVVLAQKRADTLGNLITKSRQIVATMEEFLAEAQADIGRESASERLSRTWADFSRILSNVWTFELFNSAGLRITTGKVVMAGLGLLIALLTAGWFSRWTSRTATQRFQMAEDQKVLLEKSVFLPVAAILVLTVLYWLNIPLTVFAFLGGALAIGIGFGAQNLMNNFISGLILLLERQIKVGDIIEVAGSTGKVTHLGSRCSRIRKFDGVELLVPNSAFLEKEVTNWTLADPHHRFDFPIGVAYGSPVEKVMSLLNSALERQAEILREPAPAVFFEAFGDSALCFRVYYWLELSGTTDSRQVGSELRCRIERDFRAAGVEMPFPQRDFHLRSSTPIPVRLEKTEPTLPPASGS